MPAYWRLFSWVRNQSLAGLSKRAVKDVVLNDFMQSPDDFRGRLVALELNVRRVLRYPATKNRLGIENIYEVTGFTTESQAWLYFGLTADLPKGMPVGSSVEEQATFYGYFLKLQGYYQAGARPNERPLEAPVLIGRMVWHPAVVAGAQGESFSQIFWVAILGAGLVVAGGVWLIVRLLGRRPAAVRGRTLQPQPIVPMDQWLRAAAEGGLEIDGADAEGAGVGLRGGGRRRPGQTRVTAAAWEAFARSASLASWVRWKRVVQRAVRRKEGEQCPCLATRAKPFRNGPAGGRVFLPGELRLPHGLVPDAGAGAGNDQEPAEGRRAELRDAPGRGTASGRRRTSRTST